MYRVVFREDSKHSEGGESKETEVEAVEGSGWHCKLRQHAYRTGQHGEGHQDRTRANDCSTSHETSVSDVQLDQFVN